MAERWAILLNGCIVVETIEGDADAAVQRAREIQACHHSHDEFGGALDTFAVARWVNGTIDHSTLANLPPRDCVPPALIPREFRQL